MSAITPSTSGSTIFQHKNLTAYSYNVLTEEQKTKYKLCEEFSNTVFNIRHLLSIILIEVESNNIKLAFQLTSYKNICTVIALKDTSSIMNTDILEYTDSETMAIILEYLVMTIKEIEPIPLIAHECSYTMYFYGKWDTDTYATLPQNKYCKTSQTVLMQLLENPLYEYIHKFQFFDTTYTDNMFGNHITKKRSTIEPCFKKPYNIIPVVPSTPLPEVVVQQPTQIDKIEKKIDILLKNFGLSDDDENPFKFINKVSEVPSSTNNNNNSSFETSFGGGNNNILPTSVFNKDENKFTSCVFTNKAKPSVFTSSSSIFTNAVPSTFTKATPVETSNNNTPLPVFKPSSFFNPPSSNNYSTTKTTPFVSSSVFGGNSNNSNKKSWY